jgi:hypothetical protein
MDLYLASGIIKITKQLPWFQIARSVQGKYRIQITDLTLEIEIFIQDHPIWARNLIIGTMILAILKVPSPKGYNDNHTLFVNGSSQNDSKAGDRFNEGLAAGENLISQLNSGSISLVDGETIKIVGHSQGGAFAAGLATVLSKSEKYKSILQEVVYLEPHQPKDFIHPAGVPGTQISTPDDLVASKNWFPGLKGKTQFGWIRGINTGILNETHRGDTYGGHSVGTNIDEIIQYFRSQGVTVNDNR